MRFVANRAPQRAASLPRFEYRNPDAALWQLRVLGIAAVHRALCNKVEPIARGTDDLGDWLDQRIGTGFAAASSRDRYERALIFADPKPPGAVQQAILSAAVGPAPVAILRDRFAALVSRSGKDGAGKGAGHNSSPGLDAFSDALVAQAFQCTELRAAVARDIHHFLADKVIFYPDPDPFPMLSVQTFCHLIAGFADLTDWSATTRVSFADLAATQDAAAGWAGFWDMWLLDLALVQPGFRVRRQMPSMPVAQALAEPDSEAQDEPDIEVPDDPDPDPRIRSDWATERPLYIDRLTIGLP